MATNFSTWTKLSSQQSLNVHIQDKSNPHQTFTLEPQVDSRDVITKPSDYYEKPNGELKFLGIKTNKALGFAGSSSYSALIGLHPWHDTSGGNSHELAFSYNGIWHRSGVNDTWGNWNRLVEEPQLNQHITNYSNPHKITSDQVKAITFGKRTLLQDSTNLNNITNPGTYAVGSNSSAQTLINAPTTNAFILDVINTTGSDGNITDHSYYYVTQRCIDIGGNQYIRAVSKNGSDANITIDEWGQIITSKNYTNWTVTKDHVHNSFNITREFTSSQDFQAPGIAGNVLASDCPDNTFKVSATYNAPSAPYNYGNVLAVNYANGAGQLFLGWEGSDNTTGRIWYRSHRDTATGGWGKWKQIPYIEMGTGDIGSNSSLETGTMYLVYE